MLLERHCLEQRQFLDFHQGDKNPDGDTVEGDNVEQMKCVRGM